MWKRRRWNWFEETAWFLRWIWTFFQLALSKNIRSNGIRWDDSSGTSRLFRLFFILDPVLSSPLPTILPLVSSPVSRPRPQLRPVAFTIFPRVIGTEFMTSYYPSMRPAYYTVSCPTRCQPCGQAFCPEVLLWICHKLTDLGSLIKHVTPALLSSAPAF